MESLNSEIQCFNFQIFLDSYTLLFLIPKEILTLPLYEIFHYNIFYLFEGMV